MMLLGSRTSGPATTPARTTAPGGGMGNKAAARRAGVATGGTIGTDGRSRRWAVVGKGRAHEPPRSYPLWKNGCKMDVGRGSGPRGKLDVKWTLGFGPLGKNGCKMDVRFRPPGKWK